MNKIDETVGLKHAMLCLDCETIYDLRMKTCPKCCSKACLNIGLVLGDEASKNKIRNLYNKGGDNNGL